MNSILDIARPGLRNLPRYSAASQIPGAVRLHANESSDALAGENALNRYPMLYPQDLYAQLAELTGAATGNLLAARGSSEAIDLLVRCFCRAGVDNIVAPEPTFSMYSHYAALQDIEYRPVVTAGEHDFRTSAEDILAHCNGRSRLVFICSPNNPTGTSVPLDVVEDLATARANRTLIVVDEAYIEFSSRPSAVPLLQKHKNVVVLRTLSKAYANAGARCGIAIADPEVIELLRTVQAPYAFSTPASERVCTALNNGLAEQTSARVQLTRNLREQLKQQLDVLDIVTQTWHSDANFLLTSFKNIAAVRERLEQDNILIRYPGAPLCSHARITVGSADENERLLASLAQVEA